MKKVYFFQIIFIFCLSSFLFLGKNIVQAESFVPEEYHPNYHIAKERDELLSLIIELEASQKVGTKVETTYFSKLNNIFSKIFEYFPSTPENALIYKQCDIITKQLSIDLNDNGYLIFKERCFSPIGDLIGKIQSKHTIKPKVIASPKQGAAPLSVTFDARESSDPSGETIPSDNFFWYYKDIHGDDRIIGKGPTLNYTFKNPGNHIVHLTVRSANNSTKGIFDGTIDIPVNVSPHAADIVVRMNNKTLDVDNVLRIGTHDAKKGILIDGTATKPIGARIITSHTWIITSSENKYSFKKTNDGYPGQFLHKFHNNGRYFVKLELIDNEKNKFSEKYEISVSDPVATIKVKPENGTTSDEYFFDASASYSLTSRVKTYQWLVRDPLGNEELIETKQLKRKFTIPGNYIIKMTVTDQVGNTSYDEKQLYIKSTSPVPSFIIEPASNLKNPSLFTLDATSTFDIDITQGQDELTYQWSFAPEKPITLIKNKKSDKRITIAIDKTGKYKIFLRVNDKYGESVGIEKEIKVTSTLRPEIYANPIASKRGTEISFSAKANLPTAFYEWDFGDGKKQKSNGGIVSHAYEKAGIYKLKLHAVTNGDEENTIEDQIFVGQKDMPIIAYQVKETQQKMLQQKEECQNSSGHSVSAYSIERYQQFSFDASLSVNTQGSKENLSILIHPKNDEIFKKTSMNYSFLEVGCSYIDVFAEDNNTGKTAKERVWFQVKNATPTIKNLLLDFPQGTQNNIGVGSNPLKTQGDIISKLGADPIIVNVKAIGAKDPDGFISHYARYYYETKNPENIISLKITPSNVSSTTFAIIKPRTPTEYSFGVRMVDNDGAEATSEELLGNGPVIFFPSGEQSMDIPIVSLKIAPSYANVGDSVTFTTNSEILSKKPDFLSSRYFKYDFDGDGEYDVTTKKDKISHIYSKNGTKHPKVAVFYRGYAGVGLGGEILIKEGLKPKIITSSFDNKVLVKDISNGDIEKREFCTDIKKCRKDDHRMIHDEKSFLFSYDEYGKHKRRLKLLDAYGNEKVVGGTISTDKEMKQGHVSLISIPEARSKGKGDHNIYVGQNLKNTILFYIPYEGGNCYFDLDISIDSDKNGDPTDDEDVFCNEKREIQFFPTKKEQWGKIYSVWKEKIYTKDIHIIFIDFEEIIPEGYESIHKELKNLISAIPETDDKNILYYKSLLINIKATLGEKTETISTLIQLRKLLETYPNIVIETKKEILLSIIDELSDSTVLENFGGSIYNNSKANILSFFREATKEQVHQTFREFEKSEGGDPRERKKILDKILKITAAERDNGNLDISEYTYIQKHLCNIITYYEFPSKLCGTAIDENETLNNTAFSDQTGNNNSIKKKSIGKKILKRIIIFAVVIALLIGLAVLFFAITKHRKNNEETDQDDIETDDV